MTTNGTVTGDTDGNGLGYRIYANNSGSGQFEVTASAGVTAAPG